MLTYQIKQNDMRWYVLIYRQREHETTSELITEIEFKGANCAQLAEEYANFKTRKNANS